MLAGRADIHSIRDPSTLSLGEMIAMLEQDLALVPWLEPDEHGVVQHPNSIYRFAIEHAKTAFFARLDHYTIADLAGNRSLKSLSTFSTWSGNDRTDSRVSGIAALQIIEQGALTSFFVVPGMVGRRKTGQSEWSLPVTAYHDMPGGSYPSGAGTAVPALTPNQIRTEAQFRRWKYMVVAAVTRLLCSPACAGHTGTA